MSRHGELARLMNLAAVMLANAAEDVANGHYTTPERADLAKGLDQLSAALREELREETTVVDRGEQCERS
ncbi:hypothetical protein [Haloactinomyces albus]|uniref:Uncharacterized protein n=1 Tax=Haloactinomyces albus TaxID=1352928 RepID=A0AAE4CMI4_9ACTN|nr:hypothetical protein [Haloactinomyces albus]MDR7301002.1 hypothetical protein [Haloactinomyces albus]